MNPEDFIEDFAQALINASKEINTTEIKFPGLIVQDDMEAREKLAEFIAQHPLDYKVCCGCDAVVREKVAICPQCFAYRFEDDPRTVVAHAFMIAKTPPKSVL
jgi:hypothetical protein